MKWSLSEGLERNMRGMPGAPKLSVRDQGTDLTAGGHQREEDMDSKHH